MTPARDEQGQDRPDWNERGIERGRTVPVTPVRPRPFTPPTPAPPPKPVHQQSPGRRVRRWLRTPKASLLLVFVPLLLLGGAATGWPVVVPHVLAALAGAVLVDLALGRALRRRWSWPSSALLSGLIVAFVLGPLEPHWITFAVGALATGSKYLLRTRQGHIFNPAAFALALSVPLFGTGQSWWGALANLSPLWLVLLLAGGAFILDRLNKFPLALSFLGIYFGLFAFGALLDPGRVAEMFRVPFVNAVCFLFCFMLPDPPTSPGRRDDQVWFGGLVAIVSAVAQLVGIGQTYLLVGLLAGNLALFGRRSASRWRAALAAAGGRAARQPTGRERTTSPRT
jgi:Na+-translocating ferredoxin:NAD+ oxidoreductase RnfD subunit